MKRMIEELRSQLAATKVENESLKKLMDISKRTNTAMSAIGESSSASTAGPANGSHHGESIFSIKYRFNFHIHKAPRHNSSPLEPRSSALCETHFPNCWWRWRFGSRALFFASIILHHPTWWASSNVGGSVPWASLQAFGPLRQGDREPTVLMAVKWWVENLDGEMNRTLRRESLLTNEVNYRLNLIIGINCCIRWSVEDRQHIRFFTEICIHLH